MKAAVFHGPGQPLTIEQVDIDEPKEREVIVRTVASGVCHSDLHFVDGLYMWPSPPCLATKPPASLRKSARKVSYLKPGDHVIACLSVFCGYCEDCMSGHPNLCSNKAATQRTATDKPRLSQKGQMVNQFADLSGYAEKMLLHENALVKIADDVPLDRAALIGCGVMTASAPRSTPRKLRRLDRRSVWRRRRRPRDHQGARIAGARMIIAVDKFPAKLDLQKSSERLTPSMRPRATRSSRFARSPAAASNTRSKHRAKVAAEQAYESLTAGGIATIVGMVPIGQKVDVDGFSLLYEKRVQGCFMGSNRFRIDMPRIIELYQQDWARPRRT